MSNLIRAGGIASLIAAATYIFGFALIATVLAPSGYGSGTLDPSVVVAFMTENGTIMYVWNLVIYVINGICLVVIALALNELLRTKAPALSPVAAAFGLIWATLVIGSGMIANVGMEEVVKLAATDPDRAASLWHTLYTVETGLGGGNEIVGGIWALLLGIAGYRSNLLSKALSILSIIIGVAGFSTVFTPISDVTGAVFGLGYIVWFVWTGIALLRTVK